MNRYWDEQVKGMLLKYSEKNPQIQKALKEWNSFSAGEFDTRSAPKAARLFNPIAKESDDGCVVLVLIFFLLFKEFGGLPRKSLFNKEVGCRIKEIAVTLVEEEKEIFDWFLFAINEDHGDIDKFTT